jgi:hypothetical protein
VISSAALRTRIYSMCVLKLLVLLVGCTCVCVVGENSVPKKNLLFIMFDDLRPGGSCTASHCIAATCMPTTRVSCYNFLSCGRRAVSIRKETHAYP